MSAGTGPTDAKEHGVHEKKRTKDNTSNIDSDRTYRAVDRRDRELDQRKGTAEGQDRNSIDKEGEQVKDSGEELKKAVQKQIEYYFSRENLITDTYLMSQMDMDQFVPVAVIAGFNQVKRLTGDIEVILEAIKVSESLQLDESGSKVKAHSKRCVLLVRGIPQDTAEETVKGLFQRDEECPECTHCEVAHNDAWYICFDTEDNAQKAFRYLREVVSEFNGHPLHVRLKEKVFQRNAAPLPQPPPFPLGFGRGMGFQPSSGPFFQQPSGMYMQPVQWIGGVDHTYNGMMQGPNSMPPMRLPAGAGRVYDGGRGGHHPPRHNTHANQDRQFRGGRNRDDGHRPSSGRGRKKEEERSPSYRGHRAPSQNLDLAPGNFPPLPNSRGGPPSQVRSSSADESGSSLADVVKGARGQTTTGRPLEPVFDREVPPPPPHGHQRTNQRPASLSEQMFKPNQRSQQPQNASNAGKAGSYSNRGGPSKYTGRQSDSRDQRPSGHGRNRNKHDKKSNSRNSPRSSRHNSLPPPPTSVDGEKQDLSPSGAERITYAAIAQKKQKTKVSGNPPSGEDEPKDAKTPPDAVFEEDDLSNSSKSEKQDSTSSHQQQQQQQQQQHHQQHQQQQQQQQQEQQHQQQHQQQQQEQQHQQQHQQQQEQQHQQQQQPPSNTSPSKDKVEGLSTAQS